MKKTIPLYKNHKIDKTIGLIIFNDDFREKINWENYHLEIGYIPTEIEGEKIVECELIEVSIVKDKKK